MPMGKAEWHTPVCYMKNCEQTWQKLENFGPGLTDAIPEEKITYFNNPVKYQWKPEYDHFFSYTKVLPLWDKRKTKDNSQYAPDLYENIFQQEKDKPVPVLSSLMYGRPCREPLDYTEHTFKRRLATKDFYRKRGVMRAIEKLAK